MSRGGSSIARVSIATPLTPVTFTIDQDYRETIMPIRISDDGPFVPVDEVAAELRAFADRSASTMRERLDHGAKKFGALSWRR